MKCEAFVTTSAQHVVLLTNDNNLINKALVSGVPAFGAKVCFIHRYFNLHGKIIYFVFLFISVLVTNDQILHI